MFQRKTDRSVRHGLRARRRRIARAVCSCVTSEVPRHRERDRRTSLPSVLITARHCAARGVDESNATLAAAGCMKRPLRKDGARFDDPPLGNGCRPRSRPWPSFSTKRRAAEKWPQKRLLCRQHCLARQSTSTNDEPVVLVSNALGVESSATHR